MKCREVKCTITEQCLPNKHVFLSSHHHINDFKNSLIIGMAFNQVLMFALFL